jgi:hypothetical protein
MAANPRDCRDRVHAAKQERITSDSLFIPKPHGASEILSAVRHFQ